MTTVAVGESEVGRAEIGAVEDDDTVIVEELHVHSDDAYGFLEYLPLGIGSLGGEGKGKGEQEKKVEEDGR